MVVLNLKIVGILDLNNNKRFYKLRALITLVYLAREYAATVHVD